MQGVQYGKRFRQLEGGGVKRVLTHYIRPACHNTVEHGRYRCNDPRAGPGWSAARHHQGPKRVWRRRHHDELDAGHLRALGAVQLDSVAATDKPGRKIANHGLCAAHLCGAQWRHRGRDNGDPHTMGPKSWAHGGRAGSICI